MKPQIIDRFVYVKGKKISEVENTGTLHGKELIPIADNNQNFHTTVDLISEYVDNSHDYLTTEDYNDLKGQIDSERTNRQEADNELNQSIQDTKSELHSTISNVESELLNEVNDLQGLIDNINDTGIANGVTLDTVLTITGKKTFTTVPKSTADATSANDLTNKNYVDTAISEALGDTISDVVTTNTAQEISGLKTFKTLPKGDGTPTEDTDLVNKKYVDSISNSAFIINESELDSDLSELRLNEIIEARNANRMFIVQKSDDSGGYYNEDRYNAEVDVNDDVVFVRCTKIYASEEEIGDELHIGSNTIAFLRPSGQRRNDQKASILLKKNAGSNSYLNADGKYVPIKVPSLDGYATQVWVNEQGFAKTSDIPEGLEIGETTGTAFDGGRGKAVEDIINNIKNERIATRITRSDIFGRDVNNLRVEFVVPSTGAESSYDVQFKAATTELAGLMSTADKKKLDSLSDSSDVYVIDYIIEGSGIITQELYNEIRSAIEENKVIIFTVDTLQYVVTGSFLEDFSLKLYFPLNDITSSNALRVNALILRIKSNGEYYTESPHINLYIDGDGTKYLSDNGRYKTINLDDKYLPLSGGTLDSSAVINFDGVNDKTTKIGYSYVLTNTLKLNRLNPSSIGSSDVATLSNGTLAETDDSFGLTIGPKLNLATSTKLLICANSENAYIGKAKYSGAVLNRNDFKMMYHEGNISGSKVTTNDISGGLNITSITQSAYDELQDKNANTLYIITE